MRLLLHGAALLALLLASACTGAAPAPNLGEIYDRIASSANDGRNPVVLIPGILGSRLRDRETGTVVWGAFTGDYADPGEAQGARQVALPMRAGVPLAQLTDSVQEDGALESLEIRFLGLPIGVGAYVNILRALGIGGYRDESLGLSGAVDYGEDHFTCFQFAYDWRRDIAESAARLDAFLRAKRDFVRTEYARRGIDGDVRFDVVAHSMGGLVVRYYLRYGTQPLPADGGPPTLTWAGAELVERVVLVGTPNAGSMIAFDELLRGYKPGPFLPRYPALVLGTMPAIYQLLPRPRHGAWIGAGIADADPLDPALWERLGWGLADPEQSERLEELLPDEPDPGERRRIALDHQAKCLVRARQLFTALDLQAEPPSGTELMLVAGDAIRTAATAEVDGSGASPIVGHGPGDGTVLRSSALMDERLGGTWQPRLVSPISWSRVTFLFEDHLGLTQSETFIDNLLFLLLEEPRR